MTLESDNSNLAARRMYRQQKVTKSATIARSTRNCTSCCNELIEGSKLQLLIKAL
ncbi:hypothetical protein L9F63_016152, partial [Diploptera punctata]